MVLFWLDQWEISYCQHNDWKWTHLDLRSCTLPLCHHNVWLWLWQFEVLNSGSEGLVVVLLWFELWEFLFCLHWDLNWRSLLLKFLHSTTLTVTSGFHLSQFQLNLLWCRYNGSGIILIGPLTIFFVCTRIWTGDLWNSSHALYHCAAVTSCFDLWPFQVFISSSERLVMVLFI